MDASEGPTAPRWPYAVSGLLAALGGAAAGHLVAALVSPESSPVLAVGSQVIDATPTPVKEWAVRTMGTNDKPVLIGSVAIVTLIFAAVAGLISRRHPTVGRLMIVVLAALAAAAAILRSTAGPTDVIPGLVTGLVGVGLLVLLLRLIPRAGGAGEVESPTDHNARATGEASPAGRRAFLLGAGGVTVGAAAVGAFGQKLTSDAIAPSNIALPAPAKPLPPLVQGIESKVKGLTAFRTPNADFYRIDTALVIPRVDADSWELTIDGEVDKPFKLTYADLLKMDLIEKDITMCCVSNEVGGGYIGGARWLGVPVRELLERAGVRSGADQILSTSVDGMTISTPVQALTDDREALLAIGMNGEPLPRRHGYPVRLVTPGLYGFVGSTKWLKSLTATTYAAKKAYWTEREWATDGRILTQSRIDTPRGLSTLKAGKNVIGGVAWAQGRGIEKVEIRVDDGPWQKATLGPDANVDYWRQWFFEWDATAGRHELTVRATDLTGAVQTEKRASPFPRGATGWQTIPVNVE
ncbi:putative membrane-bound oxidoreductase [Janibacter sp. HTCC2649]|uniref:molybdopterin-dependent oxidoreductase n=1 Tax=Janibacter sp. HTCC2649 TaxID=313589 RepID=UPI000067182D|nr:molybdopterin-dependent oxidoreductase [Janibacter sp. HTCC2649]EAP98448.1 putative membrane-bound oxidoreductase [Janibacter sp. HTCC2649]